MKDFTKRWKDKTECSEGYKTTDCKNGPKATPTPTAAAPRTRRSRSRPTPPQQAAATEAAPPDDGVVTTQAVVEAPPPGGASRLTSLRSWIRTSPADAVARLDELTRKLRRECPWDREQDERSIVPHTVGEAYELAAAAHAGDDAKLLDELGDVLFQVHFLSLLLEERGHGSLAEVADHVHAKLVRRHPHIFGEVEVDGAGRGAEATGTRSRRARTGREPGIFGDVPENLPGPLYALKTQRRAASTGFDFDHVPYEGVRGELDELEEARTREERFHEVGDVLFAAVNVARKLKVDPELALRASRRALPRARRGRGGAARRPRAPSGTSWTRRPTGVLRQGEARRARGSRIVAARR